MKFAYAFLLIVFITVSSEHSFERSAKAKRFWGEPEEICFDDLGCYKKSEFRDPNRDSPYLPEKPSAIDTHFHLHRKDNVTDITDFKTTLTDKLIASGKPVTFIVHGFYSSGKTEWVVAIKDHLLQLEDQNVIIVDWKKGADYSLNAFTDYNYRYAVANTWVVGRQIAVLCKFLNKSLKVSYDNMHIVGHSLGAHVAGYAGANITEFGKLGRISGLDPADPQFQNTAPNIRLDPTDAKFVDVIHTDASPYTKLGLYGFGVIQPVGHLDFYANGGITQPGCRKKRDVDVQKNKRFLVGCHHNRATLLYDGSIASNCSFVGRECESYEAYINGNCDYSCGDNGERCARMGYHAKTSSQTVNRKLYLMTADSFPFCAHQYKVEIRLNQPVTKNGTLDITLHGTATHNFKFFAQGGDKIARVTGTPNNLGLVNTLQLKCLEGDLCQNNNLAIKNVAVEPLDIMPDGERKAATTVLCRSDPYTFKKSKCS